MTTSVLNDTGKVQRRWAVLIMLATAAAFIIKVFVALNTFGTNDVYTFSHFRVWTEYLGADLYSLDPFFNHPPSMIYYLRFVGWMGQITGLGFPFWLRLPSIVADAASVLIVWKLLGPAQRQKPAVRGALILIATAPLLVMISGFHGNTDPVMIFLLLLSVYLTETRIAGDWPGGAAFGLAMSVKIVPVIAVPVIFFYLTDTRRRVQFFAAAGAVILLAWSPFLYRNPKGIVRQVAGYGSVFGRWGLSWLWASTLGQVRSFTLISKLYHRGGNFLDLGVIFVLSVWMNRMKPKPSLYSQVGAVVLVFLALASGFGVQYLAWITPWVAELGFFPVLFFYVSSGAFLFLVYDYWAVGLPWYLADSASIGDYPGHGQDFFQMLCWLSVTVLAVVSVSRFREDLIPHWKPSRRMVLVLRGAAAVLILGSIARGLVVYRANYENRVVALAGKGRAAARGILVGDELGLSAVLMSRARYDDTIQVARDALLIDPASADAYGVLGKAMARKGMWDEAALALRRAAALSPDMKIRRTLARVLAHEPDPTAEPSTPQ